MVLEAAEEVALEAVQDVASEGDGERVAEELEFAFLDGIGDFNWRDAYRKDVMFRSTYDKVVSAGGGPVDGFAVEEDGTLVYDTANGPSVCIPAALLREALHVAHDSLGHLGYRKTYLRLAARFY